MTQNRDIRIPGQSISRSDPLCKTLQYDLARSRIIGDLISFKSRDGRFVFLESLLDYLTETKGVPGLEGFHLDTDTCLNYVKNTRAACDAHWTFGNVERWESDPCCGILALHNTNWTAGKRIPTVEIVRWAINDRINRLLVLCLPPEDFVATYEQTWEAVCEEVPWKVTERYVRLSYLGDVLPWLREKVLPVAEAEDAVFAQTVAQCIAHIELRPALSAGDSGAAIREAEIHQKIEIEIAFQARLVVALDKAGYLVKNFKTPDERAEATIRGEQENEPDRILLFLSWRCFCFRVHSKDASVPFWLTVWFSSDKSSLPQSFSNWRALGSDGMSESGPSKTKEWKGVSFNDATLPRGHLLIIDTRLRFETLPLPVMRDTLLGGHLAEELASKVAVAFDRIRAITADREKALPVAEDAGLAQTNARHMADCERRPAVLADDGRAAAREAEIRQKIEIEIAFQTRLAAALDKEGYTVKSGMTPEKQEREFLRAKYENEPDRSKKPCVFFFVHSKEASASFCLGVWFSSVEPSPQRLNWRALADDGVIGAGPSKRKEWDRVSMRDATQPVCYLISISDARLRFEALPLPGMRDTLLNGHLAEELASKVALNFDRIRHYERKHANGTTGEVRLDLDGEVIRSCDRDVCDHKDADGIEFAPIDKASKESGESSNEIVLIAF